MPAELHYNLGKNDVKLEKQHVKNELRQTGNGNCQLLRGLSDNTTCWEFKKLPAKWGQSFSVRLIQPIFMFEKRSQNMLKMASQETIPSFYR